MTEEVYHPQAEQSLVSPLVTVIEPAPDVEQPRSPAVLQETRTMQQKEMKPEKAAHPGRISREADYKEHPYKYFTLREFILGVLLGFVLGFVVSKLIFGLVK